MNLYIHYREPEPDEKEEIYDIEINAYELAVILDMLSKRPALYHSMKHFLDQIAQLYMRKWGVVND